MLTPFPEYISQLEGELSAKGSEADELRIENEALKTENSRLTDLTRMLLSSPAFSTFLNDLSANPSGGLPASSSSSSSPPSSTQAPPAQQSQSQSQQQQQQQQRTAVPEPPKDLPTHQPTIQAQAQGHESAQIGMALMPETTMDFLSSAESAAIVEPINVNVGSWGVGMDFGFNAQVFAVTELPEGPAVDAEILSGKAPSSSESNGFNTAAASLSGKDEVPAVEAKTVDVGGPEREEEEEEEAEEDIELDASNPAFALFIDDAPKATGTTTTTTTSDDDDCGGPEQYRFFGTIEPEKAFARLDLVLENESESESKESDPETESKPRKDEEEEVDAATMARFAGLCANMDEAARRLANFTWRL